MDFKKLAQDKLDKISGFKSNTDESEFDDILEGLDLEIESVRKIDENQIELDMDDELDFEPVSKTNDQQVQNLFDGYIGEKNFVPNPYEYGPNATYRNVNEGIVYKKNSENLWEAFVKDGKVGAQGPRGFAGGGTGVEEAKSIATDVATTISNDALSKVKLSASQSVYPVTSYGISNNGITNVTTSLSALINTVSAGSTIYLNEGVYNFDGSVLNITKPINIIGPGILYNGTFVILQTKDVSFNDTQTSACRIAISNSTNIKINNCTLTDIHKDTYSAITLYENCYNIYLTNNTIYNVSGITSDTTYGSGISISLTNGYCSAINIQNNNIYEIYGPAGIYTNLKNATVENLNISNNIIHNTKHFGIQFWRQDSISKVIDTIISDNVITDIGNIRPNGDYSNGSTGIYSNFTRKQNIGFVIKNNVIKHVTEIGIEGDYDEVFGNYIEDTGCDQLNHPIADSAGIYIGGTIVHSNVIVNPGKDGGINHFSTSLMSDYNFTNNVIRNDIVLWTSGTAYKVDDLVVSNENWYTCITSGTSGPNPPAITCAAVSDGVCVWNYKKPLANTGITLNSTIGIEKTIFSNNTIIDMSTGIATSDWKNDVNVENNTHSCRNVGYYALVGGFGNRIADDSSYIRKNRYFNASPTSGSWAVGDIVTNSSPATSGYIGWVCTTAGTFGTLSGISGSCVATSSTEIFVNSTNGLNVGDYITSPGFSSYRKIKNVLLDRIIISNTTGNVFTSAAISRQTPVFKGYGLIS